MGIAGRTTLARYTMAAAATIFAMVLRLMLGPMVAATSPFLFFAPSVMVSAWYGGLGPGLLSTLAGALLGTILLGPDADLTRPMVFVIIGLQISWLSGQLRNAKHHAEEDARAARRSERLYRTLASNFPDGFVCLFDESLRWTLVAGGGMEVAGLSHEHMEGHPISKTLPAPTAAIIEPMCRAALEGRASSADVHHAGRSYATHFLPLPGQEGGTHAGMAIFEDITERVRAKDALQQAHDLLEVRVLERTAELHFQKVLLESLSQVSLDGILATSRTGQIIFANDRFHDMWRLQTTALPLSDVRMAMRQQLLEQQDPLSTGEPPELPARRGSIDEMVLTDGRSFERHSAPIVDPRGNSFGRVWYFRDITERKRLQQQILNASEREQQRIGQDLHDDLCQQLTGIACVSRLLQNQLARQPGNEANASSAADIMHMVQQANQRARDIAKGLQPVQLQKHGLGAALQDLCTSAGSMFDVACEFRGEDHPTLTGGNVAGVHLYRIAQEAISNAVRHGKATRILVDLVSTTDRLILTIEDDGVGFPKALPDKGLGLHTMTYRAHVAGGSLAIEARQPRGTTVICSVPLPSPSSPVPTDAAPATPAAAAGG